MNLKSYFEYKPNLDLTAAHIGISRWDWINVESEDEQKAKEVMVKNCFDVLPIMNPDKTFTKYYSTRSWNKYDNLNLNIIGEADKLYYRLAFPDLIRKFHEEKKHFYFLTNYNEVLGLVSFVNLNSQAVYSYLFQVISDIEISISMFLKSWLNQDEIISTFEKVPNSHMDGILATFKKARLEGKDNTIYEYTYIQTLGILINRMIDRIPNSQKKLIKYQSKFDPNGIYGKLRNVVMHPVRQILNDNQTISDINELLQDYSEIKAILNAY